MELGGRDTTSCGHQRNSEKFVENTEPHRDQLELIYLSGGLWNTRKEHQGRQETTATAHR